jgi:hypothetical protein
MAEKGKHVDNTDVRLPGGQISQAVHVLVYLKEIQSMRFGCIPKQFPFKSSLIIQKP